MTELISVTQDTHGTRYLMVGEITIFKENWMSDTKNKNDVKDTKTNNKNQQLWKKQ